MKKYLHDADTKCYIENACHEFADLWIIYIAKYIVLIFCIKNWTKFFRNQIGFLFYFVT